MLGAEVLERVSDSAMTEGVVVAIGFGEIAVNAIFAFVVELVSCSSSDLSSWGSSSSSPDLAWAPKPPTFCNRAIGVIVGASDEEMVEKGIVGANDEDMVEKGVTRDNDGMALDVGVTTAGDEPIVGVWVAEIGVLEIVGKAAGCLITADTGATEGSEVAGGEGTGFEVTGCDTEGCEIAGTEVDVASGSLVLGGGVSSSFSDPAGSFFESLAPRWNRSGCSCSRPLFEGRAVESLNGKVGPW